jgi:hypothetical protein
MLHAVLDQITDDQTVTVVLIASDGEFIKARTFGEVQEAIWAATETVIDLELTASRPEAEAYAH